MRIFEPLTGFAGVVEGALDALHAEGRLGLVDLAGELDELRVEVVFAGLEGEVEGVDREAVAAHARAGVEAHEAEGLGRGGVDHLPDVDPEPVAELGELVDEGDVDRAEDVLQQLRELGRLGGRRGRRPRRRSARRARGRARCRPRSGRRPASAWSAPCSRCGRGRSAPARRRGGSRAPAREARLLEDRRRGARGWCPGRWSTRARRAAGPEDPRRAAVAASSR